MTDHEALRMLCDWAKLRDITPEHIRGHLRAFALEPAEEKAANPCINCEPRKAYCKQCPAYKMYRDNNAPYPCDSCHLYDAIGHEPKPKPALTVETIKRAMTLDMNRYCRDCKGDKRECDKGVLGCAVDSCARVAFELLEKESRP